MAHCQLCGLSISGGILSNHIGYKIQTTPAQSVGDNLDRISYWASLYAIAGGVEVSEAEI